MVEKVVYQEVEVPVEVKVPITVEKVIEKEVVREVQVLDHSAFLLSAEHF